MSAIGSSQRHVGTSANVRIRPIATVTLDPLSRRSAIARPNGAASGFGYDLASRLTSLTQDVSGTTNDLSRTFTYNLASQLQTRMNATVAHAYTLPVANRSYAVNGRNQYTTVAGVTQTHDLNGNLTSDGSRSFVYDAENRLTSVSGSQSLTLTYDPLGRLRQTTAGTTTTDFLYDGDRLIAEYNGSTLLRRYAHGSGVDEPIVWYEGATLTTKRWLHPDERGSIVAWTDSSATATVYRYGPYGEPAGGDFSGSRFRYTGQIALPEASLYHYKARVYDPVLGRFLQTDPVGYEDDLNLYAYVGNDPINATDPSGLNCVPSGDWLNCDPPGDEIGSYTIPRPPGHPGVSSSDEYYDSYTTGADVPDTTPGLKEAVTQNIINDPTPGDDSPATPQGTTNDAGILTAPVQDTVNSYVTVDSNGNTVVANVSIPGEHIFDPAVLSQVVTQDAAGTHVTVVGESSAASHYGRLNPFTVGAKAVFGYKAKKHLENATRQIRERR